MLTEEKNYINALDHLRFYAAVMVIFRHFFDFNSIPLDKNFIYYLCGTWIKAGSTGVSLFLVISGFIFTVICKGGEKDIIYAKFIKNRVLRIFPLLTVVYFIVISMNLDRSTSDDIIRLILLQLNTGGASWGLDKFPAYPLWTIAVEFQFYLLFPFLIKFIKSSGVKYILTLMLTLLCIRIMMVSKGGIEQTGNILYQTLFGRLDQFLIGIALGLMYISDCFNKLKASKIMSAILMIISLGLLTCYFSHRLENRLLMNYFGFITEALLWSTFIIAYLFLLGGYDNNLSYAFTLLGKVSFSIYLLHVPIIITTKNILNDLGLSNITNSIFFLPFIGIPITVLVASLTYNAIEKPFLNLKSKHFK